MPGRVLRPGDLDLVTDELLRRVDDQRAGVAADVDEQRVGGHDAAGTSKPLNGVPRYGNLLQVRCAEVVGRDSVVDDGRGTVGCERRVHQRVGRTRDGAQLDGHDVVEDPPAVREAGQVPAQQTEDARGARRRDRHVEPKQVGLLRPGEVLEARDESRRDPGEQDGHQVCPVGVERRQVREDARIQHRQQRCELGTLDEPDEVRVVGRTRCVPLVLAAHRHDDLVEQRVAQPRDLDERADAGVVVNLPDENLLPAGRRIHADRCLRIRRVGGSAAVLGEVGDRHLQRDGVHVQLGCRIDSR